MLDLIIKLLDKIVQLTKERKSRKQGIFNEFYRELFDNLGQVHSNYLVSLQVIKDAISSNQQTEILKSIIASERAQLKGSRDHIEASIRVISEQIRKGSFEQLEVSFLTEIDTYLRSYFNGRTSFTGIGMLLDEMIEELSHQKFSDTEVYRRRYHDDTFRNHMLDEVKRCERWLETRFSDICVIYNTLRVSVFAKG